MVVVVFARTVGLIIFFFLSSSYRRKSWQIWKMRG